jgi:uncharacterized protein YhbP (UPF0306 family)
MTLGTVGPDGEPAVAALYYAHDESLRLYYLSSTRSQHAANIEDRARVAVAVYSNDGHWRQITGVQMRGNARRVVPTRIAYAVRLYASKFDFIAGLFGGDRSGVAELVGPVAQCRFYVVEPKWVRWLDNRVAFGYREEWSCLDGDEADAGPEATT